MPELPEVQSTVDYLRERVLGEQVSATEVLWARTVSGVKHTDFSRRLVGCDIVEVFRRGKFVCVRLAGRNAGFLLVHLRMSGSLDVVSAKTPSAPHDRVIINLANGKSIRFNDTRKFGRMYLVENLEQVTGSLGVEPLSEDFSLSFLTAGMKSRKRLTKALLLDQSFIAGLGNIYVDESLWKAQIHPKSRSHKVPHTKLAALHSAICETLSEAISLLGTDFGDHVVDGGMYQPRVYGREGDPCARCGTSIKRMVVGQRGTHLCPRCQKI
jgi:formamidopyrimidine-DNA glycosylase